MIGTGSLGGKGDRKGCVHVCVRAHAHVRVPGREISPSISGS